MKHTANYAAIHRWAEDNAIFEDALYEPSILIDLPLLSDPLKLLMVFFDLMLVEGST